MGKTEKIGTTLGQILLGVVDKKSIWEAVFTRRFFPTHSDLVRKLKPLSERVTSVITCNSRIVKSSSGQAGISIKE